MRTNPMQRSAPLSTDIVVARPDPGEVRQEIVRAYTELLYAIDRHRKAWTKMEQLKAAYEQKGNAFFMDNERPWKLAVGDVQWWRGETNARSNTLTALVSLAQAIDIPVPKPYRRFGAPA